MSRQTKIINIIGGPGAGKTTMAAGLFKALKKKHIYVEYVQEYAKKLVILKDFESLNNQYMVSLKQYRLLKMFVGHVDYVITDGPLVHGLYYNRNNPDNNSNLDKTEQKILELISGFDNINIVINRGDFEFENVGRIETLEQSQEIDCALLQILDDHGMNYKIFNVQDKDKIVQYILGK